MAWMAWARRGSWVGLCVSMAVAAVAPVAQAAASSPAHAAAPSTLRPLLVTVDDLPITAGAQHRDPAERERITRALLAAMHKHGVHAVGLVTWGNVLRSADLQLLELWLQDGHELGNHSTRHLDYTSTDSTRYIADVDSCRRNLSELLAKHGQVVRFFRFPFLDEGDTPEKLHAMRTYLRATGQRNMPVTIDDQDWSFEKPWVTARSHGNTAGLDSIGQQYQTALHLEVQDQERRGDRLFGRRVPQILLLHANEVGAAQWDALFTWLEASGHRFATADAVLADSAFVQPHDYVGDSGPGLWDRFLHERRGAQARTEIAALLQKQAADWSRGDLDAFCSVYAEDAAFVAPTGLTHGRRAVLERYKKRYADRAAMGTLTLDILEIRLTSGTEGTLLGDARPSHIHGASVVARWTLHYPDKPDATGLTLLVVRPRSDGQWEILQDASM